MFIRHSPVSAEVEMSESSESRDEERGCACVEFLMAQSVGAEMLCMSAVLMVQSVELSHY